MTNEFRIGYTRFNLDYPLDAPNPLAKTLPVIAIAGINTTAFSVYGVEATFPQGRLFNNYVLQDTVSLVRGTHTFRFGAEFLKQTAEQRPPFNERGSCELHAVVTTRAREGVVVSPSVWWNKLSPGKANINQLTSQKLTDMGNGATFYDALVEIEKLSAVRNEFS